MESPEQLVRSFITAYKIWNDESIIIDQRDEIRGMDIAEDNYKLFLGVDGFDGTRKEAEKAVVKSID